MKQSQKQTVKFIAPVTAKPILLYLLVFKNVEDQIRANIGHEQQDLNVFYAWQKHLFCSCNGAMEPTQYHETINELFIPYCQMDLGVAGWRHSFSTLAKVHIPGDHHD